MSVRWIPDTEGAFTWDCCDGSKMGMLRDPAGHIFPHEINDFDPNEDVTDSECWTWVKPEAWTAIQSSDQG